MALLCRATLQTVTRLLDLHVVHLTQPARCVLATVRATPVPGGPNPPRFSVVHALTIWCYPFFVMTSTPY
jgi:hypothetical protein